MALAEGLCDVVRGGVKFWLKSSMIGTGGPCPFFSYTLPFDLQLRKRSETSARIGGYIDLATFLVSPDWPAEDRSSSVDRWWLQSALG
jgi:hypothetical protein